MVIYVIQFFKLTDYSVLIMANHKRVLLFILKLALEVGDLILDWDFYVEGKTDLIGDKVRFSILGFAIFGTILFLCTVITKSYGISNSDDDDQDEENSTCAVTLSLMSTLLEDLPQIILALIVAFGTEKLISPVQIVKACYGIAEPIIQLIINVCQYRQMKKNTWNSNGCSMSCKIFEMVLSCILIICSIVLLIDLVTDM